MSETVVILNPQSGTGDHADAVRTRTEALGYACETTDAAGEAITLAKEAAEAGASTVVAAGGDGTVNEVVRGLDRAAAFDAVTLGTIPVGTGNNFAKQIGVTDLDTAFDVLQDGDRRRIDLGRADGRPFVNSCIAGLTSDSSSKTTPEMKNRFGVLAYVITTLQSVTDFESLRLTVETGRDAETAAWTGEALCVLVGNGRRFTTVGDSQANMEDGLFDVTVIENVFELDAVGDALVERLFGRESSSIVRTQTPDLTVTVHDPASTRFSLDGEIVQQERLTVDIRPKTLSLAVGDGYTPDPERP